MILLREYEPKVLLPVPLADWRAPSQPAGIQTSFLLRARLHDGHVAWAGTFESRDDLDAFLWSIACGDLQSEPALWRMPTPHWTPWIEPATWQVLTQVFITGTSGSTQSYSVPLDFVATGSQVQVISHAGSAGATVAGVTGGGGGGGGGYATASGLSLTPGGSVTYMLKPTGSGITDADASWFNGANLAASSAGVRGGSNASGATAGAGATTTNAIGTTKRAGGNGANGSVGPTANGNGGGGAAGPTGVGGNASGQPGGTGDGGTTTGSGTDGTQFDATHGCGSGGTGNGHPTNPSVGGNGGFYGAAAGGGGAISGSTPGTSRAGLIYLSYTPSGGLFFNAAMMGL